MAKITIILEDNPDASVNISVDGIVGYFDSQAEYFAQRMLSHVKDFAADNAASEDNKG